MLFGDYDLSAFKARSPDFTNIGKISVDAHKCECYKSLIQQDRRSLSGSDAELREEMTHDDDNNHSGSLAKERICTEKYSPKVGSCSSVFEYHPICHFKSPDMPFFLTKSFYSSDVC